MQSDGSQSGTYVLLIEDDRDDFFLTQDLLQRVEGQSYRLVWSSSCDTAIQYLRERHFDAVLVDYRIGERTGLDFIKEIGPLYPNTPMILLTGLRNAEIDRAAQAAGAADYLVKDSLTEELLDRSIRYACQQAQRSALLDSILSNAASGMVALDAAATPILWNKPALRALEVDINGLSGIKAADVAVALTRISKGDGLPEEFANSQNHAFEVTANNVPGGGKIIVFHDVTRRAHAEQLLRRAVADAEAASQAKSSFLATMSHELRTPLNGILGMVRVLEATEVDEAQTECLATIRSSGDNLLRLINDVLDLSKIEAGGMDLESIEVDVTGLVDDVVRVLAPVASARNIEISAAIDPRMKRTIIADPLRLKQILMNLGSNAIKFTTEGCVLVTVGIEQTQSGREMLRFSVRDSGIGIPQDKIQHLFKKFSQVDASTTRKYGGTGLGLAICRELVALMKGRIWCESLEGEGSTFSFSVPVAGQESMMHPSIPVELQSLAMGRMLLVSRNMAIGTTLGRYMQGVGGRLDVVTELNEVAGLVAQNKFLAIIVDRQSHPVDADALLKAANLSKASAPILFALHPPNTTTSDSGMGYDLTINRPFVFASFARIGDHLRKHIRQAVTKSRPTTHSPQGRGLNILMAEDNEPNQRVAKALLRGAGFAIDIAGDGAKAVAMAAEKRYDVILMDLHMPVMDGLAATKALRVMESSRDVPIIGLTASVSREDRDLCLAAGMNDHMAKPVDWDQLIALLNKLEKELYGTAIAS
jgi:signal transduction histidine kinase